MKTLQALTEILRGTEKKMSQRYCRYEDKFVFLTTKKSGGSFVPGFLEPFSLAVQTKGLARYSLNQR